MASNGDGASSSLPHLPVEVWQRVAYFVPRLSGRRYEPWLCREVDRTFKRVIEAFYIEHYLKNTTIFVDCDSSLYLKGRHINIRCEFQFDKFASSADYNATFAARPGYYGFYGHYPQSLDGRDVDDLKDEFCLRLSDSSERGYHPYIVMGVEKGLTDMLPMDLTFHGRYNRVFTFDWRTYFCTLFDEMRATETLMELDNIQSQVKRATELHLEYADEVSDAQPMSELIKIAGTSGIGCDGRLKLLRRHRRCRLAVRDQWVHGAAIPALSVDCQRLWVLDEDRVAHKLLYLQADLDDIEW